MPKTHDITIAGTTYSGVDTLRMKGANSEEGKIIDYVAADPVTITNTLGVVAGVSVSETNMELKSSQATKPTTGPYIKITGEASGSGQVIISEGYVSTDTTIPNSKTTTASVFYPVQKGSVAMSGGALSGGDPITPTVTLSNGNETNMDTTKASIGGKDTTNYPYYFKVNGTSSSGFSDVTRNDITCSVNNGYVEDDTITTTATSKRVTVNSSAGSTYVKLKAGSCSVNGGALTINNNYQGTPPVAIALTNQTTSGVTLTNSKPSGYYLTLDASSGKLTGHTKVTRAAVTDTHAAGYIPAKSASNVIASESIEPEVTVYPGAATAYASIPTGALATPTCTVDKNTGIISMTNAVATSGYLTTQDKATDTKQLPIQAAQTIRPTTTDQVINSGLYLTGQQRIEGDPFLQSQFIKDGITIFGVTGTYTATPSYTLQGTWRMDASKFTSYWPSTDSVFEQSLNFKIKVPYSETNIEYLTYSTISFGYVTGGALKTLRYDSTLAYASSTYGNVASYAGWQGEHFVPGDPAQIIIEYPQSVSEAFYNWFTNVATQLEDVGTLILENIPTTLANPIIMIPRIVNNSMVYSYYTSGYQTITDVKLNESFFIFMGLGSNPYIYQETSGVTEISSDLNDEGYYVGMLTSVSGSVHFWYDCCFDGASKVLLSNGATKALVDVNIGDTVMSYNETTGAIEENKVTALGTVQLKRTTEVTLEDDTVIRMNIYHPLYTQDGWKSITRYNGLPELTIEDKLLNSEGEYIGIKSIENVVIEEETYYTLKIEGNNNFYVNGILAQGKDKD